MIKYNAGLDFIWRYLWLVHQLSDFVLSHRFAPVFQRFSPLPRVILNSVTSGIQNLLRSHLFFSFRPVRGKKWPKHPHLALHHFLSDFGILSKWSGILSELFGRPFDWFIRNSLTLGTTELTYRIDPLLICALVYKLRVSVCLPVLVRTDDTCSLRNPNINYIIPNTFNVAPKQCRKWYSVTGTNVKYCAFSRDFS